MDQHRQPQENKKGLQKNNHERLCANSRESCHGGVSSEVPGGKLIPSVIDGFRKRGLWVRVRSEGGPSPTPERPWRALSTSQVQGERSAHEPGSWSLPDPGSARAQQYAAVGLRLPDPGEGDFCRLLSSPSRQATALGRQPRPNEQTSAETQTTGY